MRKRRVFFYLARPYIRYELPGWGKLLRLSKHIGWQDDALWRGSPNKIIRGKMHGYLMSLDLTNWSQRLTWLLGRFYEFDTQRIIQQLLKPGDTFVDVGANIGMITLLASQLVGTSGRVLAFEPNPKPRQQLREMLELNNIENVTVYEVALSNMAAEATLSFTNSHDGAGTLANFAVASAGMEVKQQVVKVETGDKLIPPDLGGKMFIKIDVEGYETFALQGLKETLKHYRPIILTELEPDHLTRAGSSVEELIRCMLEQDYQPFDLLLKKQHLRYECFVSEADNANVQGPNIIWIPAEYKETPAIEGLKVH